MGPRHILSTITTTAATVAVGTRLRATPGALATLAPGPAADPAAFLATVDADASGAE